MALVVGEVVEVEEVVVEVEEEVVVVGEEVVGEEVVVVALLTQDLDLALALGPQEYRPFFQ